MRNTEIFCDCCGKKIDRQGYFIKAGVTKIELYFTEVSGKESVKESVYDEYIDLCERCSKKKKTLLKRIILKKELAE